MLQIGEAVGGGIDFVSDPLNDPDDTVRWRITGDVHPRVVIDPHGSIKLGTGATPPSAVGTSGGGGIATYDVRDHGVYPDSDPRFVSAFANTIAFLTFEASIVGSADFLFVSDQGPWSCAGLFINRDGHRIIGGGGRASVSGTTNAGTRINHDNTSLPGTPALTIQGTAAGGGYGTRLHGTGVVGVRFYNTGPTSIGLKVKHVTLAYFEDMVLTGFRAEGGGLYAYNFADSIFFNCIWEFCGSANATNLAVIYLNPPPDGVEPALWGADALRFIACRWENNSDRQVRFRNGGGFQVNKVIFSFCKFETSVADTNGLNGSNDANQAQFDMDTSSHIVFEDCDFTLQNLNASVAYVLQTIFRLKNGCTVFLSNSQFNFGAGLMPKCFTNFFIADNALTVLSLVNTWVNSGNATAFPTKVLSATNTPLLVQRNIGFTPFQGSGKVAADWFTAADWKGVHTGAPSAGGVIA